MAKGTIIGLQTASTGVKKTVDLASQKVANLDKSVKSSLSSLSNFDQSKRLAEILGVNTDEFYNAQEVKKIRNDSFERFAQNYINTEPEILFTCDYIVDDRFEGCLVVWEKFFDSTHYEVFKKNLFKEESEFERILFLDAASLEEERAHFIDYLKNTIGLNVKEKNVYIMLDSAVKEDRIYEYKITAARVPKNASEVDYDMVLEGSGKVRKVAIDSSSKNNVFDVTGNTLGSKELAWTTCLLNEKLFFFGRAGIQKPVASLVTISSTEEVAEVLVPADLSDVLKIFNESIFLFGILPTMEKLIVQCNGLSSEFRDVFLDSIDITKSSFSYDKFRDGVKQISPVFKLVLDVAQSSATGGNNVTVTGQDALSKLAIILPSDTGIQSLSSIEGLTKVLNFVNNVYLSVLYASEKNTLAALSNANFLQDFLESVTGSADTNGNAETEGNVFQNALAAATTAGNKTNSTATPTTPATAAPAPVKTTSSSSTTSSTTTSTTTKSATVAAPAKVKAL